MNTLQKRLQDYQNGGTFPDYAELMTIAEGLHDEPPMLDKPAMVGGTIFKAKMPVRYIVESAQRAYEYHVSQEKLTTEQIIEQEMSRRALFDAIHGRADGKDRYTLLNEFGKKSDEPQPVKYVDVEKVMDLVVKVSTLATKAACSNEPISNECKNNISSTVAEIEALLTPHELKRLSDEEVDSLMIDYNELILDRSHLSAPEAMQWIIRRVESKVRGEE